MGLRLQALHKLSKNSVAGVIWNDAEMQRMRVGALDVFRQIMEVAVEKTPVDRIPPLGGQLLEMRRIRLLPDCFCDLRK